MISFWSHSCYSPRHKPPIPLETDLKKERGGGTIHQIVWGDTLVSQGVVGLESV